MKRYQKWLAGTLAALGVLATAGWWSLDKETRGLLKTMPTNRDLLFWSVPQRDAAFRALDRISLLAKWRVIEPAATPRPLPLGPPLSLPMDVDAYMSTQRSAALLVLHKGQLRLERYGLDFDATGRWTSFSVAKSFTSTLVGAAVRDGYIRSLDDKVTDYLPQMKGSAYEQVSVRQLLTMTSGVRWNEDYNDPQSDVARFNNHKSEDGSPAIVSYLRQLPRQASAGERWLYSTGETNLVGILLGQATGKPLAQYLQEKLWIPAGMEHQATWLLSKTGQVICGCCIQASPREYARFGLGILDGGRPQGQGVLPEGWGDKAPPRPGVCGPP
ncbi:MAG: serine hydrolase domain-containing protein, partial [Limnohabitans sp.]